MEDPRQAQMHPFDYLMILKRRKRWFIVPFVLVLTAGLLLTFLWPTKYRSSATIAISGGSMSSDLSHPIDRDERIRAFGQQLLALPTLARVAREEQLTGPSPSEGELLAIRQHVQISLPDPVPGSDPGQVTAYIISYWDRTPEQARRVAQRFADVFLDETSKSRQVRAEETSDFLAAQMRQAKDDLDRLDTRMTGEKAKNMGHLPEQTNTNLSMVAALRQQLDSTSTQLRGDQDRLDMVQRQMSMFTAAPSADASGAQASAPSDRMLALERELADARLKYTDKNPDVQILQDQLARARKEAAAQQQLPVAAREAALMQNPAYRQLAAERDQTRLHMRDLERTIAQINGQIRGYQERLERAPMVEQEMAALDRDYTLAKKRYEDLSNQYNQAVLRESLERKSGGEHFKLLYPATLPADPFEPNRVRLLLLTVAASLFLGVGCAVGREYLDRSVHDARTLQKEFDVPVLGEIPHIRRVA
jgi:polysaccharide chain length determinant protein (PEP-CTERM system associated)